MPAHAPTGTRRGDAEPDRHGGSNRTRRPTGRSSGTSRPASRSSPRSTATSRSAWRATRSRRSRSTRRSCCSARRRARRPGRASRRRITSRSTCSPKTARPSAACSRRRAPTASRRVTHNRGATGAPILADALAYIDCETEARARRRRPRDRRRPGRRARLRHRGQAAPLLPRRVRPLRELTHGSVRAGARARVPNRARGGARRRGGREDRRPRARFRGAARDGIVPHRGSCASRSGLPRGRARGRDALVDAALAAARARRRRAAGRASRSSSSGDRAPWCRVRASAPCAPLRAPTGRRRSSRNGFLLALGGRRHRVGRRAREPGRRWSSSERSSRPSPCVHSRA